MTGATHPPDPDGGDGERDRAFGPGTNVLVVGGGDGADGGPLAYALSRPALAEGPVTVVSTDRDAATVAALAGDRDDRSPLDVVDCTGAASASDGAAATVAPGDLPSVGEATVAALDGESGTAPVGLCLDSVSTLVARSTTQQVYKLLYVVSQRVRASGVVALYTWDGDDPATDKTLRILGQTLDYRVTLDAPAAERVRSLGDRAGGG